MKKLTLSLFLFTSLHSLAQYPGGISANLKLWVDADRASTLSTTGSLVDKWKYVNSLKTFTSTGVQRPSLFPLGVNFHSSVLFDGTQMLQGPSGVNAPIANGDDDYSLFAVWNSTYTGTAQQVQRVWTQGFYDLQTYGFGLSTFTNYTGPVFLYGPQWEIWPFDQGFKQVYTPGTWNLCQINVFNIAGPNDAELVTDKVFSPSYAISSDGSNGSLTRKLTDYCNALGAMCYDEPDQRLIGHIAEVIIYDRPVSGYERNNIFSYLGFKYGLTVNNLNYTASDWNGLAGTIFWKTSAGSGLYNNDIFGIGRDNEAGSSGIFQTVSNSMNTGSGDGTGQAGKGNIVIKGLAANIDNLEFLMIGNDAKPLTETTVNVPPAIAGSKRLVRSWKVQELGAPGNVDLTFDVKGLPISGNLALPWNFNILIDEDGDGDFTTGTVRMFQPATIAGTTLSFPNLTLKNGEVFTFVTKANFGNPLSSHLLSLKGETRNNELNLNWEADQQGPDDMYSVEVGTNDYDLLPVQRVKAVGSSGAKKYNLKLSNLPSGKLRCRIKQVNTNTYYSNIISFEIKRKEVQVFPNPASDLTTIAFELNEPVAARICLYNGLNQCVRQITYNGQKGTNLIQLPVGSLPKGTYFLQVQADQIYTKKINKL